LSAIENQGRLLSDIAQSTRENYQQVQLHQQQLQQQQQQQHQQQTPQSHSPALDHDDPDTMSRKDVPWTPITGADKILDWAVFPPDKPVRTLPASVYAAKPNPYALGV
jgi:hemolysin activation/secretion protein